MGFASWRGREGGRVVVVIRVLPGLSGGDGVCI